MGKESQFRVLKFQYLRWVLKESQGLRMPRSTTIEVDLQNVCRVIQTFPDLQRGVREEGVQGRGPKG